MGNIWDLLQNVNDELKKHFLCVPPYRCVNGVYLGEVQEAIDNGKDPTLKIRGSVNHPWQRAFQVEYQYKKCSIFQPYMPVIEYATYTAMEGNWVCAYLTFLPIVEAVLRKWGEEDPQLSFEKIRGFALDLISNLKDHEYFDDDRINLTNGYIEYLRYILYDILYIRFDQYNDKGFFDVFNRNLTLHKLEGVMDISEGLLNVTRIELLLDIIAELYFMKTPKEYWAATFDPQPEKNVDFMLRWKLYVKQARRSIGPNDLLIIYNAFIGEATEEDKSAQLQLIEFEMDLQDRIRKMQKQGT